MRPASTLQGVRVMVVDDEEDARTLATTVLASAGAKVRAVGSVDELWRTFDDYCPHVVVSDIAMPGTTGLEMVQALREKRAAAGGLTGTVALTAHAMKEQRSSGLKAGFDRYLTKPIDVDVLVDTVAELAHSAA